MKFKILGALLLISLLVLVVTILLKPDKKENIKGITTVAGIKAFPSAEGFGANTIGGRGGHVYEVTNLNDSGVGSLRNCVIASGPRTCVFKVGGTIVLNSELVVTNPYITIAGQTALGGGILLRKPIGVGGDLITSTTHDVIVQYISGRVGPGGDDHVTQLAKSGSTSIYNIIFDHCSFSWGVDSIWETWYRVYGSTIQWSFITEGLDVSTHSKSKTGTGHSKGIMIGGYAGGEGSSTKGSYDISVHHNLMAHVGERAPLMQFCGNGQVVNNVTYNPMWTFSHQEINCADPTAVSTVNWIGNYHKKGPNSTSNTDFKVSITGGTSTGRAYFEGNIGPGRSNNTLSQTSGVSASAALIASSPVDAPAITTTDAITAYNQVLNEGGNNRGLDCFGNSVIRRDAVDKRVVEEVRTGQGRIIDGPSQSSCLGPYCKKYLTEADYTKYGIPASEVGIDGWPVINGGNTCEDYDHDGMPDSWESLHGLSSINTSDNVMDNDQDGYTNLEEYLNQTNPNNGVVQPTPTKIPTLAPTNTIVPTTVPSITLIPTIKPTITLVPTSTPTRVPTVRPTSTPTTISTVDTTSPTVRVIYPANNSRLDHDNKISVYGRALDNKKVVKIEYFIDNSLTCTFVNPSSITNCKKYVTRKTNYNYNILVKVYDAANNTGSASLVVTTIL